MQKSIVILNFSPRISGNCAKIGQFIADFYKQTNVRQYQISSENMPGCHNCNYECLTPTAICPVITEFQKEVMDQICDSEIVYYILPNFCGHPCANFYSFNERSVGYFNGDRKRTEQYRTAKKKFIVVSNTENDSFKTLIQQQTKNNPDILFIKTGKYHKKSTAGDIMNSDEARADLEAFLNDSSLE